MTPGPVIAKTAPPRMIAPRAEALFPLSPHCATQLTQTGRMAIRAGLHALNMPSGARILMPAWHCGSEIDAVLAAGGVPVLYGLDAAFQADLGDLEARLQNGDIWAVYVIHYFGQAQPVADIAPLARAHGARLIEDMALALFSTTPEGTPLGCAGDMSIFSLVKTLPVPDGGALWLAPGIPPARLGPAPAKATLRGLKSTLKRFRASRGPVRDRLAQDASLDIWDPGAGLAPQSNDRRITGLSRHLARAIDAPRLRAHLRRTYKALQAALPAADHLRPLLPPLPDGACPPAFPLFTQEAEPACAALAAAGIEPVRFWRRYHPAIDLSDHPRIEALHRQVIRLPIHPDIDARAIDRIAAALAPLG